MQKPSKHSKLSNPSKFVRRVLSKTSHKKKSSEKAEDNKMSGEPPPDSQESELTALREQVKILQLTISSMKEDFDKKEKAFAMMAREKDRLTSDLKKQKRCNLNLKQQLEDEREFYYHEKKHYCQEMNDCKKLKEHLSKSETTASNAEIVNYKKEVMQLKDILNQTLEANYNLSVKFLRMKNTKTCLKNRLKQLQEEHDKAIDDMHEKIDYITKELDDVVKQQFKQPLCPSNKKYLRIVKQNGNLIHENLCLQLEVDQLQEELDNFKTMYVKKETYKELPYINSKTRTMIDSVDKNESKPKPLKEAKKRKKIRQKQSTHSPKNEAVKNVEKPKPQVEADQLQIIETKEPVVKFEEPVLEPKTKESRDSSTRYTLLQLSENPSRTSTEANDFSCTTSTIVRTQSAPEMIETSLFINNKPTSSYITSSINNL